MIFKNKRVLVTGCCGTIGSELVRQLLSEAHADIKEVIGLDNNESAIFFQDQEYIGDCKASFYVVDVRDRDQLLRKFSGIDVVFHCAALKHVILCERSPEQAVQTNIQGVENVITAAQVNNVQKVIFTSSDKAVNPTNVMGTSKLMGERLITAANSHKSTDSTTVFLSARFGNVLGSSGSVIPIFRSQIAKGGPVTLTDRDMTRFVMGVEDSVRLVIDSATHAQGGEVFITKMPVVRIVDLAQAMIEELAPRYGYQSSDIEITQIGSKPGEKLYEELMSPEETRRALELEQYFSVLPAFRGIYHDIDYDYPDVVSDVVTNPYVSAKEKPLSVEQIKDLLNEYKLLDLSEEDAVASYWPDDKMEHQ